MLPVQAIHAGKVSLQVSGFVLIGSKFKFIEFSFQPVVS